jgi:hypothetical protein
MSQPDTTAIWTGSVSLYWARGELSVGGIHVGTVNRLGGSDLHPGRDWRAWVMDDEDGRCVGWFATEREAKDALEDAAIQELLK